MKLRMLTGLAGNSFSVAPHDITDRFEGREAQTLIDAGYAELAPDDAQEKTVEEWVAELEVGWGRERLLAEETIAAAAEIAALIERGDKATAELVELTEKLTGADAQLVEGEAREKLLADAIDAAKADAVALAEKLTQAERERDDAMQQIKAINAPPAPAKVSAAKETAVKAPAAEKRG